MTRKCPNCNQFVSDEEAVYCIYCASPLPRICPRCQKENHQEAMFCSRCRSSLSTAEDSQTSIRPPNAQGVSDSFVKNSTINQSSAHVAHEARGATVGGGIHISTGPGQPDIRLFECPICGKRNREESLFKCRRCGRDYICDAHQDPDTLQCKECMDYLNTEQTRGVSEWDTFLLRYPNGFYFEQASIMRDSLIKEEQDRQKREKEEQERKQREAEARRKAAEEQAEKERQERERQEQLRREKEREETERRERERREREEQEGQRREAEARRKAEEEKKKQHYSCPVTGMPFIRIKGGTFEMGDTFGEGDDDEKPVHEVQLDTYYLGKYPVTQGEWKRVMGENPSDFKKGDNYPVENVSWDDAQEFIRQLNDRTDGKYRLPTEAEWEYAAREGGRKVRFGNGKDIADPKELNFDGSEGYEETYSVTGVWRTSTTPVDQFRPNALGLHDMSGNIWEWCEDIYADDAYQNHRYMNPIYEGSGDGRVIRGGCWFSFPHLLRCAFRSSRLPGRRSDFLGFRLARSV